MSPVLTVAVFSWGIRCQFDDSVYMSTEQVCPHLSFMGLRHPLILPEMTFPRFQNSLCPPWEPFPSAITKYPRDKPIYQRAQVSLVHGSKARKPKSKTLASNWGLPAVSVS